MGCMFLVDFVVFAVFDSVRTAPAFFDYSLGSGVFDHDPPNPAFVAVGADRSSRKHKVVNLIDEKFGTAAVDMFAVPGAMLVDQDAKYFS
jgi:hypothetical protein